MPKHGKDRLRLDRIYRAAEKAERFLPEAVEALIARIKDPETKAKDLAVCVARLSAIADARPRMEDDLGLLSRRDRQESSNPIIAILGQNITVTQFKGLPAGEREALLLAALGPTGQNANTQVPVQIPVQVTTP